MNRLERFSIVASIALVSKNQSFYFCPPSFKNVHLIAGLYKPSTLALEHSLIVTSLTGALAVSKLQTHGKRQKRTASLNSKITTKSLIWPVIDKFAHEFLPQVADFRTPKIHRPKNGINYTLRIRHRLKGLVDFDDFLTSEMYDTHKGIYLPLTLHLNLSRQKFTTLHSNEHYIRMFRLPVSFYNKRPVPAFDDLAQIR